MKFLDGSKIEFDGLMIAQGTLPKVPRIKGLTCKEEESKGFQTNEVSLAPNVFMPFYNKK